MSSAEDIKKYWTERALSDNSAQSTTLDVYLREIEFRCVRAAISEKRPRRVFDVGCGDAYTTIRLAALFPDITFVGGDYSAAMIHNAKANLQSSNLKNLQLTEFDITTPRDITPFDFIYTSRCLINLAGWGEQKKSLSNIWRLLDTGGTYLMIENFVDGHYEMNRLRQQYGLSEIGIREHNCFFEEEGLLSFLNKLFEVELTVNISSSYYLVTRVIYSKICQLRGVQPDYFDVHHQLAAELPFSGNFGPVKMMSLKKTRPGVAKFS